MSQDEFTKLFTHMNRRFDAIEKALESKANQGDMERVIGLLDAFAKRVEIADEERLILNSQIERLNGLYGKTD